MPRWRTIISPARTTSPPKRLTPRYLGLESRPFLEEPPAFFCAIVWFPLLLFARRCSCQTDFGQIGSAAGSAAAVFAPAHFDGAHFFAAQVFNDGCGYGIGQIGRAKIGFAVLIADGEDFIQPDVRADFIGNPVNDGDTAEGGAVLFAAAIHGGRADLTKIRLATAPAGK